MIPVTTSPLRCVRCGKPVKAKNPQAPGPQPKYCSDKCRHRSNSEGWYAERRALVVEAEALRARVAELEAQLDHIDWARVPPSAIRERPLA